jgi:hypothetical protein
LFRDDIKRSEAGGNFSKDAACGLNEIADLLTALHAV